MVGAVNSIMVGAIARRNLIGIMADRHRPAAVVRRSHTVVIGRRHFARTRHRGVSRVGVDHRRRLIIHRDRLRMAAAIAAGIGRVIGPGDAVAIGATARRNLVRVMADRHRPTAVICRSHTVVIGRWHLARARHRRVGREGIDHRRGLVIHCDRLAAAG